MAVRLSALPRNLPPAVHLHKANFIIPATLTEAQIFQTVKLLTGIDNPVIRPEYGIRYQYRSWYTVRNDHGAVLIAIYTAGTGRFKDTTAFSFNGLCFETWCHPSHNPARLDVVGMCRYVLGRGGWFTRLDLARNDFRRVIDWDEVVHCSDKTRFRDRLIIKLNKTKPPYYCRQDAESIYFGSNKSKTQILGYVKHDAELTKFPWIRFEVKVRGKLQCNHVADLICNGMTLDELTAGVLAYYLDFKEPGILLKHKRPSCKWWTQFVGTNKIKLVPDREEPQEDAFGF